MVKHWPATAGDFLALDADQQADLLLQGIYEAPENEQGENFIRFRLGEWLPDLAGLSGLPRDVPARQRQRHEASAALENAYSRLMSRGWIRPDSRSGSTFCKVTPDGVAQARAAELPDAARVTFARRALDGIELHQALKNRQVDAHFQQGEFETALRDGSTFLEDAVRGLAGLPSTLVGVKLMTTAFGSGSALRDPGMSGGEADGLRNLFAGFFGVVRNQLAHRDSRLSRKKEAVEALAMLDYLTEKVEEAGNRIGKTLPA